MGKMAGDFNSRELSILEQINFINLNKFGVKWWKTFVAYFITKVFQKRIKENRAIKHAKS